MMGSGGQTRVGRLVVALVTSLAMSTGLFLPINSAGAEFRLQRTYVDLPDSRARIEVTDFIQTYRGSITGDVTMFRNTKTGTVAMFRPVAGLNKRSASGTVDEMLDQVIPERSLKIKGKRERIGRTPVLRKAGTGTHESADCKWVAYAFLGPGNTGVVAVGIAPEGNSDGWAEIGRFARSVDFGR